MVDENWLPVDTWIPVKDLVINDFTQCIHVDTRDFHCKTSVEGWTESKELYSRLRDALSVPKYLIDVNDIKDFLLNLESISGGKCDWRFLSFKNLNYRGSGWLKYIRLYRANYHQFVVTNNGDHEIDISLLIEENLNKEVLNCDY